MVGAEGIGYRRSWRRACRHDLLDCQVRVLNHRVAMCPKSTPQHITAVRHSGPLLTARTKPNGMISGSFSVRPLRRRACLRGSASLRRCSRNPDQVPIAREFIRAGFDQAVTKSSGMWPP